MSLFFLLLLLGPANADAPPAEPPAVAATPAPEEAEGYEALLESAKQTYLLGRHDEATEAFRQLVLRAQAYGDVPAAVEHEALAFLGEIQYMRGEIDDARATFRLLLQRDPEWRMSPWVHPPAVRGTFESVRDELASSARLAQRPTSGAPWWSFAPFGVPQLANRQPVRGGLYAALQVGFGLASVASWIWIDQVQAGDGTPPLTEEEQRLEQAQQVQRARRIRDAMSIPTASAFYLTWAVSVADAQLAWRGRRGKLTTASLGASPTVGGAQLHVAVRF